MKKNYITKGSGVKGHRIVSQPISSSALTFDDLFEEISDRWQEKAKRLQIRRWRKIKHQLV